MVRKCVLLMGLFLFFAAPIFAQDSLVCIKPSTSRYFLEADDERWILREKDSISNEIIYSQSEALLNKDKIISLYQNDSIIFKAREESYETHIAYVRSELIKADKQIKKQKLLKWGIMGLTVLGIFLL